MTLSERLSEYVRACFTGIWVRRSSTTTRWSRSPASAASNHWSLATWDIDRGLNLAGRGRTDRHRRGDPLAAIRRTGGAGLARRHGAARAAQLPSVPEFGRGRPGARHATRRRPTSRRTFVVVLAPVVQIPVELEKQFVVVEHDLPGRDQLAAIARGMATEPGELPEGEACRPCSTRRPA